MFRPGNRTDFRSGKNAQLCLSRITHTISSTRRQQCRGISAGHCTISQILFLASGEVQLAAAAQFAASKVLQHLLSQRLSVPNRQSVHSNLSGCTASCAVVVVLSFRGEHSQFYMQAQLHRCTTWHGRYRVLYQWRSCGMHAQISFAPAVHDNILTMVLSTR